MHQFGWISERGGNFLNLVQKKGGTQKGGIPSEKGRGGPTPEETMLVRNTGFKIISCLDMYNADDDAVKTVGETTSQQNINKAISENSLIDPRITIEPPKVRFSEVSI